MAGSELPLLEILLRNVTPEERAAIDAAEQAHAFEPGAFYLEDKPPPWLDIRGPAIEARIAILQRVLAGKQPKASAINPKTGRREEFDLEILRGKEGYLDWQTGDFHWS